MKHYCQSIRIFVPLPSCRLWIPGIDDISTGMYKWINLFLACMLGCSTTQFGLLVLTPNVVKLSLKCEIVVYSFNAHTLLICTVESSSFLFHHLFLCSWNCLFRASAFPESRFPWLDCMFALPRSNHSKNLDTIQCFCYYKTYGLLSPYI